MLKFCLLYFFAYGRHTIFGIGHISKLPSEDAEHESIMLLFSTKTARSKVVKVHLPSLQKEFR
jgi:hypothetical protein